MVPLPVVERENFHMLWDRIAGTFESPDLKTIDIEGMHFQCIHAPWTTDGEPKAYLKTGLNFLAWVRVAGIRHRFVLQPIDSLVDARRWEIQCTDIVSWIIWANHMSHLVTFSTLKSGAGFPLNIHGQSIPLVYSQSPFEPSNSLCEVVVPFGEMPRFQECEISTLENYLAWGIRITGRDTAESLIQVAEKVFELALNYDNLKGFNLVILPQQGLMGDVLFFPRRRDGKSIYGKARWQVAGLEFAGVLLCREKDKFDSMNAELIRKVFESINVTSADIYECLSLLNTF